MPDTVLTGSFTVADGTGGVTPPAGSVLDLGTEGNPAVSIDLEGTFVATFVIEATSEAGPATDWFTPVVLNAAGVASSATLTAAGRRFLSAAGIGRVRLRCTAFTSGAPTATLRAGQGFVSAGGGGGGGGAVTVADGADVAQGTTTDAGVITNASGTVIGFLRGAIIQWAAFLARLPAALVSGRLDVNIGATGVTQPVSGTVTANAGSGTLAVSAAALPLPAGASTEATLAAQSAKLPAALVGGRLDVNVGASASLTIGTLPALPTGANSIGTVVQGTQNAAGTASWNVQGAAATGAGVAGSPVLTGGKDLAGNAQPIRMQTDGTQIVGGISTVVSAILTRPANTTTYTAGDEITDTGGTIRTITGAARFSGGSGVIAGVGLSCSSNGATLPSLELWIFDTTSTPQTDNAAFAPADGEVDTVVAIIPLNLTSVGTTGATGNFWMDTGQISAPFVTAGSANLFLRVVVRNGYTPGANSDTYKFRFRIFQD